MIQYGDADVMIAGGSEAAVTPMSIGGFGNMTGAVDAQRRSGAASRPFDATRDGFVLGEGAGVVMLEELEHARKRGARILAKCRLRRHRRRLSPHRAAGDHEGLQRAMRRALEDGGSPADVQYINAHGTSTPLNDPNEIRAIKKVFGAHADGAECQLHQVVRRAHARRRRLGGVPWPARLAIVTASSRRRSTTKRRIPSAISTITPNTPVKREVSTPR
jgi:3-oxoacyl-(acyl-carrier-protein) synthase